LEQPGEQGVVETLQPHGRVDADESVVEADQDVVVIPGPDQRDEVAEAVEEQQDNYDREEGVRELEHCSSAGTAVQRGN
jgi:hypothetical protein